MASKYHALWIYPTAYGLAQVVTGIQAGFAANLLVIVKGWSIAEALATAIPLAYPLAIAQVFIFAFVINAIVGITKRSFSHSGISEKMSIELERTLASARPALESFNAFLEQPMPRNIELATATPLGHPRR